MAQSAPCEFPLPAKELSACAADEGFGLLEGAELPSAQKRPGPRDPRCGLSRRGHLAFKTAASPATAAACARSTTRTMGQPLYSDVYYAPISTGGALGSFVPTTSLPLGMCGHSATVSADGKVPLRFANWLRSWFFRWEQCYLFRPILDQGRSRRTLPVHFGGSTQVANLQWDMNFYG